DGDGRRNALDAVHLRAVHAVEELARVGTEGLHVAPLAFGIQRVEGEGGLAGAGHAGDDGQLAEGKVERQVAQVVLARTVDADGGSGMGRGHGSILARGCICIQSGGWPGCTTAGTGRGPCDDPDRAPRGPDGREGPRPREIPWKSRSGPGWRS